MREIKFRVWINKSKRMEYTRDIAQDFDGACRDFYTFEDNQVYLDDVSPLMQLTGRKDEKGKDIYEGDVVINRNMHGKVFCIEYRDDSEYVGFIPVEINKGDRLSIFVSWNKLEVIGNIYEGYENNLPQKK